MGKKKNKHGDAKKEKKKKKDKNHDDGGSFDNILNSDSLSNSKKKEPDSSSYSEDINAPEEKSNKLKDRRNLQKNAEQEPKSAGMQSENSTSNN